MTDLSTMSDIRGEFQYAKKAAPVARSWMQQDVKVVLYHNVTEVLHPLTSQLNVSIMPEAFRQHVRYLSINYDLISAGDLLSQKLPRKPLLITFDDAYRSVLDCAAGILRDANAPAIFFVSLAAPAKHFIPLDNLLSLAIEELGIDQVVALLDLQRGYITSAHDLIHKEVPKWDIHDVVEVKERTCAALGQRECEIYESSRMFLDLPDIGKLKGYGVEVGNHSMHHLFFRGLSRLELRQEITESQKVLERATGRPVTCFSIPYGNEMDATASALEVARESGHRAVFLVHGRSNRFRPSPDIYYRIDPGSGDPGNLRRKLSVEPLLRTIRDLARRAPNPHPAVPG